MRTSLRVPYADVRADDLAWRVGDEPERPALAVLEVPVGPRAVVVARILGSSHQVVVEAPHLRCVETVACGVGDPLPSTVQAGVGTGRYAFAARVRRPDARGFFDAVAAVDRMGARHDVLVAAFGNAPDALTAVAIEARFDAGVLAWRTWHTYPQTHEVVVTRGEVVLRSSATEREAGGRPASGAAGVGSGQVVLRGSATEREAGRRTVPL